MDYDIIVDNDMGDLELKQKLESLAQAGIQNQMLSFSTVMKIFTDPSLTSIMRRIETDEANMAQSKQSEREDNNKIAQAQIASQEKLEQLKLQLDDLKNLRDNETKLKVADKNKANEDSGELAEDNSMEIEKISLQREQMEKDYQLKMRQLNESERHNQATESIQRSKPKTSK